FDARMLCRVTVIHTADGEINYEYILCEITEPGGDVLFLFGTQEPGRNSGLKIIGGTGDFRDISGSVESKDLGIKWPGAGNKTAWKLVWSYPDR
ncbi:unnamed protein product, partial [marine sediment metagenome]